MNVSLDYSKRAIEFILTAGKKLGMNTKDISEKSNIPESTIRSTAQRKSGITMEYFVTLCNAVEQDPVLAFIAVYGRPNTGDAEKDQMLIEINKIPDQSQRSRFIATTTEFARLMNGS